MSDLVVKDNALIEASYTLGLAEQRLILLAIIEARETSKGIDHNSLLRVHAHTYAEQFNIDKKNAYEVIREASKGIFDRYVTYHDKNPKNGNIRSFHCRWVDKIGYEKDAGTVFLRFTSDVVPLITRLEEQFTSYEIEQVASLDSGYAIRLYELLIKWRTKMKTPVFELQDFRQKLGVEDNQYKTMSNFKKYVLDFAVQQINEHTDITTKYEQKKQGRKIVGFEFSYNFKINQNNSKKINRETAERDADTIDMFDNLTDKERELIKRKNEYADSRNITDSLHRQNLIKQALAQHREAERAEQLLRERVEAKREAEAEQKRAAEHAAQLEEQKQNEQAKKRRQAIIALYESLEPELQSYVLDEVEAEVSSVSLFAKIFAKERAKNEAHKSIMLQSYFEKILIGES